MLLSLPYVVAGVRPVPRAVEVEDSVEGAGSFFDVVPAGDTYVSSQLLEPHAFHHAPVLDV